MTKKQEYAKQWRADNAESIKAYKKQYRIDNKEKINKYFREYYQSDKGKSAKYSNKDKIAKYKKYYNQTKRGKELKRIANQARRTLQRGLDATFTLEQWKEKLKYYGYRCAYCNKHQRELIDVLQQDHFVPVTKGGGYTDSNIVPACKSCNVSKGDKTCIIWLTSQRRQHNGL